MKNSILTVAFAASLIFTSCVDRKTSDNGEVDLETQSEQVTPEDMYQTSGTDETDHPENLVEINSAKKVINDYFDALKRGEMTAAYEEMSRTSNRGTSSEFAEKHSNIETVTLSFTKDPEVINGAEGTDVKMPLRYTIKTKEGNTETYNGSVLVVKKNKEDADYKIQGMTMTREDS
ncbi:hypothetical protein [Leeuwenhoekiella marinoflava]|uniref:Uncharacterized protein n=2 Tax=Leeuwenhoekiella marinoflava TaxID=988 RepID=A0A4Q0PIR9_9FLAO|nr:hypothetical protein [Leeuwenhoekiella marinoflava]RXG27058.1 hypothetical protein DSL99_3112 [Leeuwenhoekiella marinoflava]SHF43214.1 hypothetical protein SAMN02745246_02507 [Leeuwenhoekiella marinoflava DSM 3653]